MQAKVGHCSPTISGKWPTQEAALSLASSPGFFSKAARQNPERKAWVWGNSITATSQSRSYPLEAVSPTHLETIYSSSGTLHPVRKTAVVHLPDRKTVVASRLHYIQHYTTHTTRAALPYPQTHRCLPACVTRKAFWQNSNRVNMTANFSKSQTAPSIIWKLWGWVQCEGGGLAHWELQDEVSKPTRQLHIGRQKSSRINTGYL